MLFKDLFPEANVHELNGTKFADFYTNWIYPVEGGYVNHPNDPGGETKYGISKARYPKLDIKPLKHNEARWLYYQDYYLGFKIDQFPKYVREVMLDFYINTSPKNVVRTLQRTINRHGQNLIIDGIMGKNTMKAFNAVHTKLGAKKFAHELIWQRALFFSRLGGFKHFGKGWLKRLDKLKQHIGV